MKTYIIKKEELQKFYKKGYHEPSAIVQVLRKDGWCLNENQIMITREFKSSFHFQILI